MCDFLSFCVDKETEKIYVYDGLSHSNTETHFKLKPDSYVEAEWVLDVEECLYVRDLEGKSSAYKASILCKYPTRQDFIDKYFTEEVQLEAVKQDGYAIKYISNPSEKVQLAAVKQIGYAIGYIKNPSEAVQLEAVKKNSYIIKDIKNPTEKVKEYCKIA